MGRNTGKSVTGSRQHRLATITSLLLIGCLPVAFASGILVTTRDFLGFQDAVIESVHRVSSYILLALAIAHVYFYRRSLVGKVRRWLLAGRWDHRQSRLLRQRGESPADRRTIRAA